MLTHAARSGGLTTAGCRFMPASAPDSADRDFAAAVERAKMSALYQFAYGAGHDINNPLANIVTRAQTLLAGETNAERRRMLAAIVAQAQRAHEMIGDLMLFAKPPAPQWSQVDLAGLLARVVAEATPAAIKQQTALALLPVEGQLTIQADATQLAVALSALITNALEALATGGRIELSARGIGFQPVENSPKNDRLEACPTEVPGVEITLQDSGPGIDPAMRPHIFDPFFSGREAGRGIGFGLCKCWRIVDLHGGTIAVENSPLGGARFVLQLPCKS